MLEFYVWKSHVATLGRDEKRQRKKIGTRNEKIRNVSFGCDVGCFGSRKSLLKLNGNCGERLTRTLETVNGFHLTLWKHENFN